jgi:hypothetical protein
MGLFQDWVDFVEGGTGSSSETCVTCDVDSTEEGFIKVEDPLDLKDEIPEAESFPQITTEHEVRLWGVCEVVVAHVRCHLMPQRGNCEMTLI